MLRWLATTKPPVVLRHVQKQEVHLLESKRFDHALTNGPPSSTISLHLQARLVEGGAIEKIAELLKSEDGLERETGWVLLGVKRVGEKVESSYRRFIYGLGSLFSLWGWKTMFASLKVFCFCLFFVLRFFGKS